VLQDLGVVDQALLSSSLGTMALLGVLSVAFVLISIATCMDMSAGRKGHGLIGYGINMYKPNCAFSCRAVVSGSSLNCSTMMEMEGMGGMDHSDMMMETSPECYATDHAFLQTMAYCIYTKCSGAGLQEWELEKYWKDNIPGTAEIQPIPKWTYQQARGNIVSPPTETLVSGDPLNRTMLVSDDDWLPNFNAQDVFEEAEGRHSKYRCVYDNTSLCGRNNQVLTILHFTLPSYLHPSSEGLR